MESKTKISNPEPEPVLRGESCLKNINLDLYEHKITAFIGPSGCGKSTLGRCLVNLHPITSGKLVYDGKELNRLRKKERQALSREIQMVFQDPYAS